MGSNIFLSWRSRDAILLGEANAELDELLEYYGSGERTQMLLNFMVNQQLFNAIAQESAEPLVKILQMLPVLPEISQ